MSWLRCLHDRTGLDEPGAVQLWGLGAAAPARPCHRGLRVGGTGCPKAPRDLGSPLWASLCRGGWGGGVPLGLPAPRLGGMLGALVVWQPRVSLPATCSGWSLLRGFRFCISWCGTSGSHPSGLCLGRGAPARAEQRPQAGSSPAPFLLFSFSIWKD